MNEFAGQGIFSTTNQQLAFALATAGCAFAPQELNGPAVNMYSVETLRAKDIGRGLPLDDAVRLAVSKRISGNVGYVFLRSELLTKCIKAWDEVVEALREAEATGQPITMPNVSEETVMAVLCVHANNRKQMAELPWFNQPWVNRESSSTQNLAKDSSYKHTRTNGVAKLYQLNLSGDKKEQLRQRK